MQFLRPRWTSLYAARKRQKNAASILPELPDTFFGWIPALYRITEDEVLASAGLDAFVVSRMPTRRGTLSDTEFQFLSFFRLATRFIAVTFFFQLVVMLPVHHYDTGNWGLPNTLQTGNQTRNDTASFAHNSQRILNGGFATLEKSTEEEDREPSERMLWLYVFFVYLFSGFALYFIVSETKKIIRIRQDYLGSQSTVTDRTIRLSGIPEELRSEEMIKETIESLQIGKVESVLLCKDWREIDQLVAKRKGVLRKLEEAWTVYLGGYNYKGGEAEIRQPTDGGAEGNEEDSRLLDGPDLTHKDISQDRPMTRMWYGIFNLQSRKIDAIDYYEEKLRKMDEQIRSSRQKVFKPMPLAFVTLDSTATAVSLLATCPINPLTVHSK